MRTYSDYFNNEFSAIAFDLDGTLLDTAGELSPAVVVSINELKKYLTVFIATGRMLPSALPFWKQLELDTPIISYNGAKISHPRELPIINKCIPQKLSRKVADYFLAENIHLNAYADDRLFVYDIESPITKWYSEHFRIQPNRIDPANPWPLQSPTKLLAIVEEAELDKAEQDIRKNFGSEASITTSSNRFVEILPPQTSKGEALKILARELSIPLEKWIAVGDGINDVEMLQTAGLGIAVENGHPELKAKADMVIPHIPACGIDSIIERCRS